MGRDVFLKKRRRLAGTSNRKILIIGCQMAMLLKRENSKFKRKGGTRKLIKKERERNSQVSNVLLKNHWRIMVVQAPVTKSKKKFPTMS